MINYLPYGENLMKISQAHWSRRNQWYTYSSCIIQKVSVCYHVNCTVNGPKSTKFSHDVAGLSLLLMHTSVNQHCNIHCNIPNCCGMPAQRKSGVFQVYLSALKINWLP